MRGYSESGEPASAMMVGAPKGVPLLAPGFRSLPSEPPPRRASASCTW